jgi:hypothetical protein
MSRFRFLLLWLMLLALPMQGFAAAGMLFCGPGHHGATPQAISALADHPDGAMAHSHQHGATATSDQHSAQAHHATPEKPQSDPLKLDKVGADKCSVCSACCNAAAMPVAAATTLAIAPQAGPIAADSVSFAGFIEGQLERPPRPILG